MDADILRAIYEGMYGPLDSPGKLKNLTQLAGALSGIARKEPAWTARYLNGIVLGHNGFAVSEELERAISILTARMDGQSEAQARSREITVLTTNGIEPGSIVFGHTTRCYCQLQVVFNHPCRKYCFEECRQRARAERKRARI